MDILLRASDRACGIWGLPNEQISHGELAVLMAAACLRLCGSCVAARLWLAGVITTVTGFPATAVPPLGREGGDNIEMVSQALSEDNSPSMWNTGSQGGPVCHASPAHWPASVTCYLNFLNLPGLWEEKVVYAVFIIRISLAANARTSQEMLHDCITLPALWSKVYIEVAYKYRIISL